QAEDGIRDFHVTGVQTCALPISSGGPDRDRSHAGALPGHGLRKRPQSTETSDLMWAKIDERMRDTCIWDTPITSAISDWLMSSRSEERRVGKAWRYRWAQRR